jgi:hypothetical protein
MPMHFPARYVPCLVNDSATLHAAAPGSLSVTLCGLAVSTSSGVDQDAEPYCPACNAHMKSHPSAA